jgi:hypothetical protein
VRASFDAFGAPRVEIEVKGSWATVQVSALLDTGVDGDVSLPIGVAIQLGLELQHDRVIAYVPLTANLHRCGPASLGGCTGQNAHHRRDGPRWPGPALLPDPQHQGFQIAYGHAGSKPLQRQRCRALLHLATRTG